MVCHNPKKLNKGTYGSLSMSNQVVLFNHVLKNKPADLLLKGLNIVDVNCGTIFQGNIAIFDKYIIALSEKNEYPAKKVLDEKGRLDFSKADPFVFNVGEYWSLKKKIGTYGYSKQTK